MKKHILMIIAIGLISVGLFASVESVYADSKPDGCIAFTSDAYFQISLGDSSGYNPWDGIVEVSSNGTDWIVYTAGDRINSDRHGGEWCVFFRGGYNHGFGEASFKIRGEYSISCTGNIENLLDHATVQNGQHPEMSTEAFAKMFYGCQLLIKAPELSATTLTRDCYAYMFQDCTSLTEAPELPAKTLAERCYEYMFCGCPSLKEAPSLPATTLADYCYLWMFDGCTSLTKAPELPATTLAPHCYEFMFGGCSSLTIPPELPATTLAGYCYYNMFEFCTSLTIPPELPATTLAGYCYKDMFDYSGVKISSEKGIFDGVFYAIPYRIPGMGEGTIGEYSLTKMFSNTQGPFTGTPEINTTYYLPCAIGTPLTTMKAKGKKSMTIAWEPVEGVDGYDIFFAKCAKKKDGKNPSKLVKTIEGNDVSQWTKTGLKKGKSYKAYVRAFVMKNNEKEYKEASPLMHAYAAGGDKKHTNAKSVSVNASEVSLAVDATFQIKAKVKKLKKKKKLMPKSHVATIRYLSTDDSIAAVDKKGLITAIGTGECYVYAYAHNGAFAKVKVTIE